MKARDVNRAWHARGAHAFLRLIDPKAAGHAGHARCRCHVPGCTGATDSVSCSRGDDALKVFCHRCGTGGDAIKYFQAVRGDRFPVVCDTLGTLAGISDSPSAYVAAPAPAPVPSTASQVVFETICDAYPLECQPDVVAYLRARRVCDAAIADGWGALPSGVVAQRHVFGEVAARAGEDATRKSGLFHPDGRIIWGDHRLVIPWRWRGGLTLVRRAIAPVPEKVPRYVIPQGYGQKGPYGDDKAHKPGPLVICEGAFDVLSIRTAYPDLCVVGLSGAQSTLKSADLVRSRDVHIATDNDSAGDEAFARLSGMLKDLEARGVARWPPPQPHKDWNSALVAGDL